MRLLWGALLLAWTLSASAAGGGKVISDIDGTLRRTNARAQGLEVISLVWQAFVGNNYFSGMPEILRALSGGDDSGCFGSGADENYAVSYVTAAPVHIKFVGQRFLRKSCFPQGSYHARPYLFGGAVDHKYETIMSLIESSGSERVLLLGDNGENDIPVYDRVAMSAPGTELDVFIHMVYSAPKGKALLPGQRPFLTGADLAAQLYELGWISLQDFETVVNVVHQDLLSERSYERVFPRWVSCEDFVMEFRWPVLDLPISTMNKIIEIDQAIGERCFRTQGVPVHVTTQVSEQPLQCSEVLL